MCEIYLIVLFSHVTEVMDSVEWFWVRPVHRGGAVGTYPPPAELIEFFVLLFINICHPKQS